MTDNDIKKALECCRQKECNTCPCYDDEIECGEMLIGHTIDLINRLQGANEGKIDRVRELTRGVFDKEIAEAKTEAIKAFAERLRKKSILCSGCVPWYDIHEAIDNLVKEMTEASK